MLFAGGGIALMRACKGVNVLGYVYLYMYRIMMKMFIYIYIYIYYRLRIARHTLNFARGTNTEPTPSSKPILLNASNANVERRTKQLRAHRNRRDITREVNVLTHTTYISPHHIPHHTYAASRAASPHVHATLAHINMLHTIIHIQSDE